MKIIVATHNEGKLAEIRRILEERLGADAADIELVSAGSLGLPDPVEDGVTFQENALIKARNACLHTGLPSLADDSGLVVPALGGAPGIHSARYADGAGDPGIHIGPYGNTVCQVGSGHQRHGRRWCHWPPRRCVECGE